MAPRSPRKYARKNKLIRRKRWARPARKTVNVNRALNPIPQRYITKLKYSQVLSTDSVLGSYKMNLNSLFDPDFSGGGHQPYGFDQLAALYNRYRVISCGYRIQLAVVGTGPSIMLTAMPSNQNVTAGTGSEIRENPRAKYIVQNPGASAVVLSNKVYIPSLVGRNKAQYMADDRYQSLVTSSPNEDAYLNIQTFAPSTDLPLGSVAVQIVMEFTAEFFDMKALGQS